MSTALVAPSYTTTLLSTCATHPNNACIEATLTNEPQGEDLSFTFVNSRYADEPTQIESIEIFDGLLKECKFHHDPAGYVRVNSKTVHLHYEVGTDVDVLFEASGRLRGRLEKITTSRNATHRRDAQTHLVQPRQSEHKSAASSLSVW